ncbi:MAG: DUF3108 domain-containing protein [Porticoccaceae bacterium]|nr:DUF3108 domain-containing protein [Porticoccaceae bacterium]
MRLLLKIFTLGFLTLFLLPVTFAFSATSTVPTFKAEYKLSHNDIEIGHVTLTVKKLSPNQYQLTSSTKTSGLLAFIRDDDVVETSKFELANGKVRPIFYQYIEDLGDDQRNVTLSFDWEKLKVTNTSKGRAWKLKIIEGVLDKALMQIALMLDLGNTTEPLIYQIADGGRLKQYAFSPLGKEHITINNTSYKTIKLARKKDDKPLITYYWCATDLHNLPILLKREKTYGTFEMRLLNVKFTAEKIKP